jgi:hypothetical protein
MPIAHVPDMPAPVPTPQHCRAPQFARRPLLRGLPPWLALTALALLTWWHGTAHAAASGALGNLGGVPVRIPPEFAHFLEYEGDPALLEARTGPVPTRSLQSPIRSFGFDILYPEMLGVTPQTATRRQQATIETSMWLSVTVLAGTHDRGEHFLAQAEHNLHQPALWKFPLKTMARPLYGLTGYAPERGSPMDKRHKSLYVHRNAQGQVDTYIECSNRPWLSAPCTLHADLRPAMRASLEIHFRRDLLGSWADMQRAVIQVMASFKTQPD